MGTGGPRRHILWRGTVLVSQLCVIWVAVAIQHAAPAASLLLYVSIFAIIFDRYVRFG